MAQLSGFCSVQAWRPRRITTRSRPPNARRRHSPGVIFRFGAIGASRASPNTLATSHAAAKLSAPSCERSRQALSRLIPTRAAAAATDPVSASAPMNCACREGVHPSRRVRVGTGANGGMRGRRRGSGERIAQDKPQFIAVGKTRRSMDERRDRALSDPATARRPVLDTGLGLASAAPPEIHSCGFIDGWCSKGKPSPASGAGRRR